MNTTSNAANAARNNTGCTCVVCTCVNCNCGSDAKRRDCSCGSCNCEGGCNC